MQEINWTLEELALLKANSCILQLSSHEIIFNEDSPADYIYYIRKGHIKHYHNTVTGKEIIVSICKSGEIIGLPAVLLRENRGVFAKTMEKCVLWRISRDEFIKILEKNINISIKLIMIFCSYVRNYEYRLEDLLAANTEAKVASLLCHLAGKRKEDKYYIDYRITHQEMANMIGACRQTVTEILGRFQDKGLIRMDKNNALEIPSWDDLYRVNSLKERNVSNL
ncbi:Crp/Fnr family transcriptional regulator [Pectinatus haikarae]|uniref:CRP-like cAMP-binding protein n=1 Tax=Pectinatus haikarae TaxID=349096 RepID=A0ABT9Y9U0_9FIRM|nr:Crp/Fnr family transcriptional regulator [Pectinatus haikarae]MDQ0204491.1 CRP-like cAMP-binding protein [Pectinatus haikarae]